MDSLEIASRFKFYPADTEAKRLAHEQIRAKCGELAQYIADVVPAGRESALAITNLEQVMMWANAGLARNP